MPFDFNSAFDRWASSRQAPPSEGRMALDALNRASAAVDAGEAARAAKPPGLLERGLNAFKSVAEWAPLREPARRFAENITDPNQMTLGFPGEPQLRGFIGGAAEGAANLVTPEQAAMAIPGPHQLPLGAYLGGTGAARAITAHQAGAPGSEVATEAIMALVNAAGGMAPGARGRVPEGLTPGPHNVFPRSRDVSPPAYRDPWQLQRTNGVQFTHGPFAEAPPPGQLPGRQPQRALPPGEPSGLPPQGGGGGPFEAPPSSTPPLLPRSRLGDAEAAMPQLPEHAGPPRTSTGAIPLPGEGLGPNQEPFRGPTDYFGPAGTPPKPNVPGPEPSPLETLLQGEATTPAGPAPSAAASTGELPPTIRLRRPQNILGRSIEQIAFEEGQPFLVTGPRPEDRIRVGWDVLDVLRERAPEIPAKPSDIPAFQPKVSTPRPPLEPREPFSRPTEPQAAPSPLDELARPEPEVTQEPPQPVAPVEAAPTSPLEGPSPPPAAPSLPDRFEPGTRIPRAEPVDASTIGLDPKTFQFKESDAQGVTGSLKGVTKWDQDVPVAVYERADGTRWIADGHQRLNKYRELQAKGQELPPLQARVYREADGVSVEDMVRMASLRNVQQGSAQPADIGRLIWNGGELSPAELATIPKNAIVGERLQRGLDLGEISHPRAREMVINKEVNPDYAAAVGRYVKDPDQQLAVTQKLAKAELSNLRQADDFVRSMAEDEFEQVGLMDMFGGQDVAVPLAENKAKLADAARRALNERRAAFKGAIKHATKLEEAGNQLVGDVNVENLSEADKLKAYFDHFARAKGTHTNDALAEAARSIVRGEGAQETFLPRILDAVERDLAGTPRPGGEPGTGIAAPAPVGTGPEPAPAGGLGELLGPERPAGPVGPEPAGGGRGVAVAERAPMKVAAEGMEYLAPEGKDYVFVKLEPELARSSPEMRQRLKDAGYQYRRGQQAWFKDLGEMTHADAEAEANALLAGAGGEGAGPHTGLVDQTEAGPQPRLPGDVGEARPSAPVQEPQFEAPFALNRESAPRPVETQTDLGALLAGEETRAGIPERRVPPRESGAAPAKVAREPQSLEDLLTGYLEEQAPLKVEQAQRRMKAARVKAGEAKVPARQTYRGGAPEESAMEVPAREAQPYSGKTRKEIKALEESGVPPEAAETRMGQEAAARGQRREQLAKERPPEARTEQEMKAQGETPPPRETNQHPGRLDKGGVTRANAKRAAAMKEMLERGRPEDIDNYAKALVEQIERDNEQAFKWGTSAAQEGPKKFGDDLTRMKGDEQTGEYLGSGFGGIEKFWKENPGLVLRSAGGSIAGLILADDEGFDGAELFAAGLAGGALGAAATPARLKAIAAAARKAMPTVARDVKKMAREATFAAREQELQVRAQRDYSKDISRTKMWRSIHTVDPNLFYDIFNMAKENAKALAKADTPATRKLLQQMGQKQIVGEVRAAADVAGRMGHKNEARYLTRYAEMVAGRPSRLAELASDAFLGTLTTRQIERAFHQVSRQTYRTLIGHSVSTALVNRTQALLMFPKLGLKGTVKGIVTGRTKAGKASARAAGLHYEGFGDVPSTPQGKVMDAIDKSLFGMMHWSDEANRVDVYNGAKEWAIARGHAADKAERFAVELTMQTQGIPGDLSGNPYLHSFGPLRALAKYPTLYAEYVVDLASHPDKAVAGRAIAFMTGVAALTAWSGINLIDVMVPKLSIFGPVKDVALSLATGDESKHLPGGDVAGHSILEDVASSVVPNYWKKAADVSRARLPKEMGGYGAGFETRTRYNRKGQASGERTALEDLGYLVGVPSTRISGDPVRRVGHALGLTKDTGLGEQGRERKAYQFERTQQTERQWTSDRAKRALRDALLRGDDEAVKEAASKLTPGQLKGFYRSADRTPMERIRRRLPRDVREEFDRQFGVQ